MKKSRRLLSLLLMFVAVFVLSISVQAAPKLNKKKVTLMKGTTITVKVKKAKQPVIWSSSNNNVAVVNNGNITGINKGSATVYAKIGTKSLKCKVKVEDPSINKSEATIEMGKKVKLKVTGTKQKVKWKSSNKKVAKVTKKGSVKGVRGGTAVITATVKGRQYTCNITVIEPSISHASISIAKGATFQLSVNNTSQKKTWKSSNKKIAKVSKKGLVTGVKAGKVKITAKVGKKKCVCEVTVQDASGSSSSGTENTSYIPEKAEKYGKLTGTVTYLYNNYRGHVADVNSTIILVPYYSANMDINTSHLIDLKYDGDTFDFGENVYSGQVNGLGTYTINHIPEGKYRVLIVSGKTSTQGWFDATDNNLNTDPKYLRSIALGWVGRIREDDALTIAKAITFHKFAFGTVSIIADDETVLDHDFGITYI